jgi:hypothetical protein
MIKHKRQYARLTCQMLKNQQRSSPRIPELARLEHEHLSPLAALYLSSAQNGTTTSDILLRRRRYGVSAPVAGIVCFRRLQVYDYDTDANDVNVLVEVDLEFRISLD